MQTYQLVWFKRDLRLSDNAAIQACEASAEPVIFLYIFEPLLLNDSHYEIRHWRFVWQSLQELQARLQAKGHRLWIVNAEAIAAFKHIFSKISISRVFSHQETGILKTFERDIQLQNFFKHNQATWKEFPTNGVIRGLKEKNTWQKRWEQTMGATPFEPNWENITKSSISDLFPTIKPHSAFNQNANFQIGGESVAHSILNDFLTTRYPNYMKHISQPELSRVSCSRLSPYIAWGNISMRQIIQAIDEMYESASHKRALHQFSSRLHWQSHFIQKFERECRIETQNFNTAFNTVRQEVDFHKISKWENGETGYPLVDACMRCLAATGWINFRMRAMVVSFLTHQLWQPWQAGSHWLARQFLDFEPGIHYPQLQMQAGTTGLHILRIYDPVKQSLEKDTDGVFIKKWLPELKDIPTANIHQPWNMTPLEQGFYNYLPNKTYPSPIVNAHETGKKAAEILWPIVNSQRAEIEAKKILKKHILSAERSKAMQQGKNIS